MSESSPENIEAAPDGGEVPDNTSDPADTVSALGSTAVQGASSDDSDS